MGNLRKPTREAGSAVRWSAGLSKPDQEFGFWRAMRRLMREVSPGTTSSGSLIADFVTAGETDGRRGTSSSMPVCEGFVRASGPILECGSGLSTLSLGAWRRDGNPVWSLETTGIGRRVPGLSSGLQVSLRELAWRPLAASATSTGTRRRRCNRSRKISLAICDGPPGGTRGGRLGLVPVMLDKLRPTA